MLIQLVTLAYLKFLVFVFGSHLSMYGNNTDNSESGEGRHVKYTMDK